MYQSLIFLALKLIAAIILCEAITEIVVGSSLFSKPRELAKSKLKKVGELFNCGYCLSVWMGVGAAYLLKVQVTCTVEITGPFGHLGKFEPMLFGFVIHRASNWLHEHFTEKKKLAQAQAFGNYYPQGENPTPTVPQDGEKK